MRKYAIVAAGLTLSVVLGATVFREPIARAAQSLDVNIIGPLDNGNVRVHEEGTANVNVTNGSLAIAPAAPITNGGSAAAIDGGQILSMSQGRTASALSIKLTSGVAEVVFAYQGNDVAEFFGPEAGGNDSIVLALARPIEFDRIVCSAASSSDLCSVSWVGAQP